MTDTENQAAATPAAEVLTDRPTLGEPVVFHARPGELRRGNGRFSAIVTAVNEDDTVDLVVVFDADDFIGQRHVSPRSLDGGMGYTRLAYFKNAADVERLVGLVEVLTGRVEALEAAVDRLTQQTFGDRELPEGESILGVLDEHEDRIQAAEKPKAPAKPKKPKKPKAASPAEPKGT